MADPCGRSLVPAEAEAGASCHCTSCMPCRYLTCSACAISCVHIHVEARRKWLCMHAPAPAAPPACPAGT
eukprot:1136666-Pelagomonas_calceolata.AAC.2